MRTSTVHTWLLVLLCAFLAACATPPEATATPAATTTPTATPTPMPPTPTQRPLPTPTKVALPVTVVVQPDVVQQTIREVGGGNFVHRFSQVTVPLDPVGALNLETLNPRVVRVRISLEDWEPVNDDDDPQAFNWDAYQDSQYNHATFGLMQDLAGRGVTLVASAWEVPDWMVSNPEADRGRRLVPELYPEVVEALAAWLLWARDEYGAMVAYISFNEADMGVNVSLSPEEVQTLVVQAGERFTELGLETRWLLADAANLGGCRRYAEAIWEDATVRPYMGPLACHSWDGVGVPEGALEALRQYARELERELWVTEGGWDPFLWQRSEAFPTWQNAQNLAVAYSRVLKSGGGSSFLYWQMSGLDYNTNDGVSAYPILDVLSQFAREFPAGAQVIETSPNPFTLFSVAARTPSHTVLHMVNTNIRVMPVRVEGLPDGTYHHVASSEAGTLQPVQVLTVTGGVAEVMLMPKSVNVLTTQAP